MITAIGALLALAGLLFATGVWTGSSLVVLLAAATAGGAVALLVGLDRRGHTPIAPALVTTDVIETPDTSTSTAPEPEVLSIPVTPEPPAAEKAEEVEEAETVIDVTDETVARASVEELLADVAGLGPKRLEILRDHFASVDEIRAASTEDLTGVPGVGPALAERIRGAVR